MWLASPAPLAWTKRAAHSVARLLVKNIDKTAGVRVGTSERKFGAETTRITSPNIHCFFWTDIQTYRLTDRAITHICTDVANARRAGH
jgi:hypothetical protein